MIVDAILTLIFSVLHAVIDVIPDIGIVYNADTFQTFFDLCRLALWVLPSTTIFSILALQVAVTVFRIGVSVVKTIWDLIPIV